jgi:hypothetical protein
MGVPLQSVVLSVVLTAFLLLSAACYSGVAFSWRYRHLISSRTFHNHQSSQLQLGGFEFHLQKGNNLRIAALATLSKVGARHTRCANLRCTDGRCVPVD